MVSQDQEGWRGEDRLRDLESRIELGGHLDEPREGSKYMPRFWTRCLEHGGPFIARGNGRRKM